LKAQRRGNWGAKLLWDYWEQKVVIDGLPL
jgi:hypothetical protein